MVFLPHTNTVILLEPYCGTITEPGLPVSQHALQEQSARDIFIPPFLKFPVVPRVIFYVLLGVILGVTLGP